jgi:formylglycine-generating enzyme required for sulfatase activity
MLLVPPGTFQMGCVAVDGNCFGDELPRHSVTITEPFYLGRYEVLQSEWTSVMSGNPSAFRDPAFPGSQNRPVERVSWESVQPFLAITGLRLPTEAEWEYAYRGGDSGLIYHAGNNSTALGSIGWYFSNASQQTWTRGLKNDNKLGFHDMSGNVWEWCSDWWQGDYYSVSPSVNPGGPPSGTYRVMRGGSWIHGAEDARASNRGNEFPWTVSDRIGFRVARTP